MVIHMNVDVFRHSDEGVKVCHEALETKMVPHNPCHVPGCDYSRVVITEVFFHKTLHIQTVLVLYVVQHIHILCRYQ